MQIKRQVWLRLLIALLLLNSLAGCMFSSESQQAKEVTERFWQAMIAGDFNKAKNLSTWDSAQYLQYLSSKSVAAKRFEIGEIRVEAATAEVATILYSGDKGDMPIPLRTVLVRDQNGWLVDVQKTMGSMVSGAMGAVVDQLNNFMENSLKGLDKSLSDNVNKLNETLRKGVEQLQKDLTPPANPATPIPPDKSSDKII